MMKENETQAYEKGLMRRDLLDSLKAENEKLNAWKKVQFTTTEDGKPFRALSKNFTNATICQDGDVKELCVFYGHEKDAIYLGYRNRTTNTLISIDEIKEEVANTIAESEKKVAIYKKHFSELDALCDKLNPLIDEIKSIVDDSVVNDKDDFHYLLDVYIEHCIKW